MPYDLRGRNVLVTGGSRGLGAVVAEKFAAEGSNIVINYVSNKEAADQVTAKIEKEHKVKVAVVQGDVGIFADCQKAVHETIKTLGGIDIIVNNAGWTRFSDFGDLSSMSDDEWDKCWNTNVKSQLWLLREALPTFKANPDGGVFLISSSVAGLVPNGSSMPYAVTKAAGLHLMKCLASTQGPKVRVNAVLPGLLLTDWGLKYSPERIKGAQDQAILKQETKLDDCADAYISAAKNTSMTAQKIQIDSGLYVI